MDAMRDRRASSTADASAAARAYGAMQKDPALRGPDDMAIRFVGPFFRFVLLPGLRSRFVKEFERRAAGVFFHHQARTKYIDACFLAELAAGIRCVVLLGAGFDTRAYRFAAKLREARVFEVDHPATGAEKQRRVRRALGAAPPHVTYVPVDFTKEKVEERLSAAGYDPSRPTLFIWEGVSPYLDAAAVDATLAMVAKAAKRSSIVFDYVHHSALEHPDAVARQHLALAAKMGEPYQFGVDPENLPKLLLRHELTLEDDLSAEDLSARYLVASDGARWGNVTPSSPSRTRGVVSASRAAPAPRRPGRSRGCRRSCAGCS
jgi:methyltransferase (TIGR00027 family)